MMIHQRLELEKCSPPDQASGRNHFPYLGPNTGKTDTRGTWYGAEVLEVPVCSGGYRKEETSSTCCIEVWKETSYRYRDG